MENFIIKMRSFLIDKNFDEKLYGEIKRLILISINNLDYRDLIIKAFGNFDDGLEELTNEIVLHILKKKDKFIEITNKYLTDKDNTSEANNRRFYGYVVTTIQNLIIDSLKKEGQLSNQMSSTRKEKISLDENTQDENKSDRITAENMENPLAELRAEFIFSIFEKEFDKEQLCYFFYKKMYNEEIFFEDKSNDARYKIVQRVKEKLQQIIKDYDISPEELKIIIRRFMSDVCEKIRPKK